MRGSASEYHVGVLQSEKELSLCLFHEEGKEEMMGGKVGAGQVLPIHLAEGLEVDQFLLDV